ncbi:hypothetical protein Q4519_00035 [Motilimonas sp. 1_MG-2023]|uniref:hypothetical protein n=1 Tax=Motilimonas sp. 1_MG-2023 TaxID=3062672 RepID=UPI0026E15A57|nr:hypothetical protein [Motilimonas sp. 1_MG-2023]MDO6524056.1 hypothetical protein [Motilimonas sp. 1_MG-2023]
MKKYLYYWCAFILTVGLVVAFLDVEVLASQRLNRALAHLESAAQAEQISEKKYHYEQALSDISKLKRQFPESQVYADLEQSSMLDVRLLQAKYNQLASKGQHSSQPDYLSQSLHLIQQQAEYERLEYLLKLASTVRKRGNEQQKMSFYSTLKQLVEIESNATSLCQAYEVLAWQSLVEENHRWLEQISLLLSGNINHKMQQNCMAAYFNIASSTSYIPDLMTLSGLWEIKQDTLYVNYSAALVRHGFFNLAEIQQQKISDPSLLAQAELFQLKAQWPSLTLVQWKEQALLDASVNIANIAATEQKELQTMRLAEFLFQQQELVYASNLQPQIRQPLNEVWYRAVALNATDIASHQELNIEEIKEIVVAYQQAERTVKLQLGFHELMDIWLKEQMAISEKGAFHAIGELLFRHYLTQPTRRLEIVELLEDLTQYHSIEQVKGLILFLQQSPDASAVMLSLGNEETLDVLELIVQQQDPELLQRWLSQPFPPAKQIANLSWLASWQAKVKS